MDQIHQILKDYWGYSDFRQGQQEAIEAILAQKDVAVYFPTGGGKSLCYQVPALVMDGICIVISPLIALMQDQVDQLRKRGVNAEFLHSGLNYFEIDRLLDNAIYGDIKLLYISPERLRHDITIERLKQMNVSFIAVDEAHCISQWGHDFRPAYRLISELREILPKVPFMSLTATATKEVRTDIHEQLKLTEPSVVELPVKRENLRMVVYHLENKYQKLEHIVTRLKGSGIIYVRSRLRTEELAKALRGINVDALAYHAGLSAGQRKDVQAQWMRKNDCLVVATNAFGMGVDKSNVRYVIHYDLSTSLEEYVQESGRAGRDGETGYCIQLYNNDDVIKLKKRLEDDTPSEEYIADVYHKLAQYLDLATGSGDGDSFDFDLKTFTQKFQLETKKASSAIKLIEHDGWIDLSEGFYMPSRVQFVDNREALYAYQMKNQYLGEVVKVMLRMYEGMFTQPVKISEKSIAARIKATESQLRQVLEQLAADDMIDYYPRSDKAKITYLLPRSSKSNFRVDKNRLNFLRTRNRHRVESITGYLELKSCRMTYIGNYFNSKIEDCGRCDNCVNQKSKLTTELYASIRAKIIKETGKGATVEEIMALFPSNRSSQVTKAVEMMLEEEWLIRKNHLLSFNQNRSHG